VALAFLREPDEQTRFAIWKIEETADELLARLRLDARERAKLETLGKGKRTLHWLATRVLLRCLLETEGHIACPSDPNGKPYLPDFPYKISLTHSYDYAGAMMSARGECGIDLEIVKEKVLRVRHKFLKPSELDFIPEGRIEQLYACWCAKEAVYKLQGNRGVSFRENMTILPFDYRPQGVMTLWLHKDGEARSFQVHYEEFQGYMLGFVAE